MVKKSSGPIIGSGIYLEAVLATMATLPGTFARPFPKMPRSNISRTKDGLDVYFDFPNAIILEMGHGCTHAFVFGSIVTDIAMRSFSNYEATIMMVANIGTFSDAALERIAESIRRSRQLQLSVVSVMKTSCTLEFPIESSHSQVIDRVRKIFTPVDFMLTKADKIEQCDSGKINLLLMYLLLLAKLNSV